MHEVPAGKTAVYRDFWFQNLSGAPGVIRLYTLVGGTTLQIYQWAITASGSIYEAKRLTLEAGEALRMSCTIGASVACTVAGALLDA